jgi:hypothetical protein
VIRARVQARIAEIMRAGAERAEVTVEQVVRELKLLGTTAATSMAFTEFRRQLLVEFIFWTNAALRSAR